MKGDRAADNDKHHQSRKGAAYIARCCNGQSVDCNTGNVISKALSQEGFGLDIGPAAHCNSAALMRVSARQSAALLPLSRFSKEAMQSLRNEALHSQMCTFCRAANQLLGPQQ